VSYLNFLLKIYHKNLNLFRNYKRVAETWMDEYAQYVYERDPEEWNRLDVGDTSYMKGIRKKLKCKPFKYFLEQVAPDMLDRWPPYEVFFASGAVSFLIEKKLKFSNFLFIFEIFLIFFNFFNF
jgi:hypothetical protein